LGYDKRYLTSRRKPWFKLEEREIAPIWVGVFFKGRLKVVRNLTNSRPLTCFHCFYPNSVGDALVDALFLYLRSDAAQRILSTDMRHYGDNLKKFEPGDLNKAHAPSPSWLHSLCPRLVADAITHLKHTGELLDAVNQFFNDL